MFGPLRPVLTAAAVAAVVSGAPSTVMAIVQRRPVLEATRAAGTLLGAPTLSRALLAHGVISLWWAAVLARVLPRRRRLLWGAAAGVGIAALDLEVIGRRLPAVRGLPKLSQYADHAAFGLTVAVVLDLTDGRDGPRARHRCAGG